MPHRTSYRSEFNVDSHGIRADFRPMNGTPPAALRITAAKAPADAPPDEAPPDEGGSTFEVTGAARQQFGTECKVGDSYALTATATEVTPDSITFTLDDVESEPDEGDAGEAGETGEAAPDKSKTAVMTYS